MILPLPARRDLLLGSAAALLAIGEVSLRGLDERVPLLVLAVLVSLSLAWRTRAPLAVLAANVAGAVAIDLAAAPDDYPWTLGLVLLICVYTVGAHVEGWRADVARGLLAALVFSTLVTSADRAGGNYPFNAAVGVTFLVIVLSGAWLAGRFMRRRRHQRRAAIVEREQRERAVLRAERARIARELHDVVAHAISVILLQARGAGHALAEHPADAGEALAAIETTAARALAEMRRLLMVLRADEEDLAVSPQPSLSEIEALIGQVRAAGLPVELRVTGKRAELPAGVDLCGYRVVQEALTNALKHAGPATATVLLRYAGDAVTVEVADTGGGSAAEVTPGAGLAGMRERVALLGGRLESGPRANGGFVVSAWLPL